ncbi:MAG: CerR family C-terminal domain-containing protein [Sneathiella sp.]
MVQTIDLKSKAPKKTSAADKLLEAAGPLFSDRPFDVVSTREIADAAQVNLSAISYHFGSKEGLYEAIFKRIISDLAPVRDGLSAYVKVSLPLAKNDVPKQRQVISALIHNLIDAITDDNHPRWRMRLMFQEVQRQGPCFDLVLEKHINVMHDLVGSLIALIIEKETSSEDVKFLTQAVLGLCLQHGLNEALVMKRLNWEKIGPAELEIIKQSTTGHILALLGISNPLKA